MPKRGFIPFHRGVGVNLPPFQIQEPLQPDIDERDVGIAGPGTSREILDELLQVLGGRFPLVGGQLEIGGMIKHSAA